MINYLNRCWNEEMDVKYHNTPSSQKPGSTHKCMDRYEIARFDTSPIWDIWHPVDNRCCNEGMNVKYHNTPSSQKPGSTQKCMDW